MKFLLCLVLVGLRFATAQADDDSEARYYLGAGIADVSVKNFGLSPGAQSPSGSGGPDISATSWKVLAGLQPISWRWFELEADYFGTASTTENPPLCSNCTRKSEASAVAGYLVGMLPMGRFADAFLKIGPEGYRLTVLSTYGTVTDRGTRVAAGAGVQVHRGRIGLRLEYERLPAGLTNGMEFISLAVTLSTG